MYTRHCIASKPGRLVICTRFYKPLAQAGETHMLEVQELQTNGLLCASGLAADGGSMASLFAQVQQLQTAVTALTSQPHLVSLADCI